MKTMVRRPSFALLAALAACSDSTPTVEFAALCKVEHDGKTIVTTGYLQAPFAGLCRTTSTPNGVAKMCSFDLRDKPDGEVRVSLNVLAGSEANRVEEAALAAKKGAAAIKGDDGKFLADKVHVRVVGTLHALPNGLKPEETICWLDVQKIEPK